MATLFTGKCLTERHSLSSPLHTVERNANLIYDGNGELTFLWGLM